MIPAELNLKIYKGDTYELFFRIRLRNLDGTLGEYIDLTGSVAKSQIRISKTTPGVLAEFDVVIGNQVIVPGNVILTLTSEVTTAISSNTGVWDVQITSPTGEVSTYMAGEVEFIDEVTHA